MTHAPDGALLHVGRKTGTVPPALRRALGHRDRGCRFPGCGLRFCDARHLTHWADGGATCLGNLVLLCRRRHRAVHEDGFRVELEPGRGVTFYRPDGRILPTPAPVPRLPDQPGGHLLADHRSRGIVPDLCTTTPLWAGETLDLDMAVAAFRSVGAFSKLGSVPSRS
jgi:hypothetical protein